MNDGAILSFSAPLHERHRVLVHAAPVLELTYAYYYLMKRLETGRDNDLAWIRQLRTDPPAWLGALRSVWHSREVECLGYELFILACGLGYALDATPERFLEDFPSLPQRLLDGFDRLTEAQRERQRGRDEHPDEDEVKAWDDVNARLRQHFRVLADPSAGREMQAALGALWAYLQGPWEREGRAVTEQEARRLESAVRSSGDVLQELPAHHFVQFEDSAAEIRELQQHGSLVVVPLFFASQGGFNLDVGDVAYLGYGVHSESLFEQQQRELADLAGRLKAFSDPTRLLLLALIARLSRFPLTVGDLARQVGVTQPTASGHLKMLRELGLVAVTRKGNRSYYHLDADAVRTALREMEQALVG